jgi:hypothetical protein
MASRTTLAPAKTAVHGPRGSRGTGGAAVGGDGAGSGSAVRWNPQRHDCTLWGTWRPQPGQVQTYDPST